MVLLKRDCCKFGDRVGDKEKKQKFDTVVAPHLAAAYNLARWLVKDPADAEDVVQEAFLRAFRFLDGFRGGSGRSWLLSIVRNTCYTWLRQNRVHQQTLSYDEAIHDVSKESETEAEREIDQQLLRKSLERLPVEYREAIVLRDLEGLSYKEIADTASIPIGTVMSRLARGREQLRRLMSEKSRGSSD